MFWAFLHHSTLVLCTLANVQMWWKMSKKEMYSLENTLTYVAPPNNNPPHSVFERIHASCPIDKRTQLVVPCYYVARSGKIYWTQHSTVLDCLENVTFPNFFHWIWLAFLHYSLHMVSLLGYRKINELRLCDSIHIIYRHNIFKNWFQSLRFFIGMCKYAYFHLYVQESRSHVLKFH